MEEVYIIESMAEEAFVPGHAEEAAFTESVEVAAITGIVTGTGEGTGAAALALAAWWAAARCLFFSFSAAPRWRGR